MGDVDQKIDRFEIIMNENVFMMLTREELANEVEYQVILVSAKYLRIIPAMLLQNISKSSKLRKYNYRVLFIGERNFMLDYKSIEHFFSSFKKTYGVYLH